MSTTVYTYNDRLVGVGNDQILGTSQGGGSTYTAGDYISIDNGEISVTGISAGDGTLTIVQNVTGGSLNIIYPTDVAPVSAFYDLNAQYDDAQSNRTGPSTYYYVFKSPGYDNDTWSASTGDVIQLKVNEAIEGLYSIMGFYSSNSNPASSNGPTINYPISTPLVQGSGSVFTVEPGLYITALGSNPAGSSYGKYICLMVNKAQYGTYVDNILDKIEFTISKPNVALGTTVNLNRYYLGNYVNTSTPSSDLACQVTVDALTKQQTAYMPSTIPNGYRTDMTLALQYGSNYNNPTTTNYNTKLHKAYKYTSSPERYQFAYLTDWNRANKLMTFVAYDNSGNAIEKWTLDYTTYSSNIWTTTPIETGSTYTAGDYISIENDEIAVTGVGNLVAGNNITITESGNNITISSEGGGSTYTAGQYISIDSNDVIAVTGLAPVSGSDGIAVNNNVVSLDTPVEIVAGDNITISVTGASAIISAQGGGSSYTAGTGIDITNNEISVDNIVALKTDIPVISLNGSDQVTAIDGHMLAGGGQSDSNVAVYTNSNLPDSTQLDADIAAGKAICIIYSGRNYWYDRHSSDYYFYSADAYSGFLYYLYYRPSNNRWFTGQLVVASQSWVNNKGYLPASAIELNDNNQVSGISGHPLAGGGGTTYTAGNMIDITNDTISVETSAGITDIVSVTALPANPVATVIYLIPET